MADTDPGHSKARATRVSQHNKLLELGLRALDMRVGQAFLAGWT
jgi:hypothetical protein